MSFRILNQAPQYLLPDGRVNAGGSLTFYETDLTTLKDTWSDADLTVLNANPVVMDSAGRTMTDVFGDGEYGVVMADGLGAVIWTRNNVSNGADAGATIPALVNDQFLSNDGSNLQWQPILQVPDPTGLANYVLSSDGTGVPVWQQSTDPVVPDPEIVVAAGSLQAGVSTDTNKAIIQSGIGSTPGGGGKTATASGTFTTPYTVAPVLIPTITGGSFTPSGALPRVTVTSVTTTGFNLSFSTLTGGTSADNQSGSNLTGTINFGWIAFGNRTVT